MSCVLIIIENKCVVFHSLTNSALNVNVYLAQSRLFVTASKLISFPKRFGEKYKSSCWFVVDAMEVDTLKIVRSDFTSVRATKPKLFLLEENAPWFYRWKSTFSLSHYSISFYKYDSISKWLSKQSFTTTK